MWRQITTSGHVGQAGVGRGQGVRRPQGVIAVSWAAISGRVSRAIWRYWGYLARRATMAAAWAGALGVRTVAVARSRTNPSFDQSSSSYTSATIATRGFSAMFLSLRSRVRSEVLGFSSIAM